MPKDPLQHKYAPSVLTVVQCARRLIAGLHGVHTCFDHHFVWYSWYFWSTVYFACVGLYLSMLPHWVKQIISQVMLGALVTESPGCTLSSQALHDLENFLPLYEQNTLHLEAQDSVVSDSFVPHDVKIQLRYCSMRWNCCTHGPSQLLKRIRSAEVYIELNPAPGAILRSRTVKPLLLVYKNQNHIQPLHPPPIRTC